MESAVTRVYYATKIRDIVRVFNTHFYSLTLLIGCFPGKIDVMSLFKSVRLMFVLSLLNLNALLPTSFFVNCC